MPQGDEDLSTAGAQIRKYLDSQGKPYTAANVKAVLAMNARNSNQAGPDVVEGLRNYAVETPRGGTARGSGGSGKRGVDTGNFDEGGTSATPAQGGGQPTTSAQPQGALDLTNMILTGLGLGGAGAGGLYAYSKYAGRPMPEGGPAAREVPNFKLADQYGPNPELPREGEVIPPGRDVAVPTAEPAGRGEVPNTGRVIDVPPTGIEAPPPRVALPAPPEVSAQPAIPEAAMQKALVPPGVAAAPPPAQLAIPAPPPGPNDVRVPGLPPGVSPVDAANAQIRANPQVLEAPAAPVAPPAAEVPPVQPPTRFKPTGPARRMVKPEGAMDLGRMILKNLGKVK